MVISFLMGDGVVNNTVVLWSPLRKPVIPADLHSEHVLCLNETTALPSHTIIIIKPHVSHNMKYYTPSQKTIIKCEYRTN